MTRGLFITATGTGVGKTFLTRGLARALCTRGNTVAAIKPLETDCHPRPLDAHALARACGRPDLAENPDLYRVPPPLAPYAATLAGEPPPPDPADLASTVHRLAHAADVVLVEGAGGLLVPLDATHTMADLGRALAMPLLLVTRDGLGVLSHTLTAVESARARSLPIAAVVLTRHTATDADPSLETNARILRERFAPIPVLSFPSSADDDDALARAAEAAGLLDLLDPPEPQG